MNNDIGESGERRVTHNDTSMVFTWPIQDYNLKTYGQSQPKSKTERASASTKWFFKKSQELLVKLDYPLKWSPSVA